jgi:dipeptidase E
METRLLLGGSGSEVDEFPIHALFGSWVRPGPVLYLPMAAENIELITQQWIQDALRQHGVDQIELWKTFKGHSPADLDRFRGIFIGGGNTYHLLKQLRTSGFDLAIADYFARGGVVYGGSAGAIIMGLDISACTSTNRVGLTDLHGLNLLDGDTVWCHYQASDEPLVEDYVQRSCSTSYALPETGGLWVRGHKDYLPLGSGPIVRFDLQGKHTLKE